ncbi:MAG: hypothetical protein ABR964_05510 [Tepidisphaeraceae bacterium]|jgi:hypothetical protein
MASTYAFFEHPGPLYNFLSLAFCCLGVALGICALVFAYVQIAKTLTAAKAARDAALSTAKKFGQLNALIEVQRLAALAGEAVILMRSNDFIAAAIRAHDLRMGISQFRQSAGANELGNPGQWQPMIMDLATVERDLRTHNPSGGNKVIVKCADCLGKLHEDLHAMAGIAGRVTGE